MGQVLAILCPYESDNSPIKTFDELLSLAAAFAAHSTCHRLLCAFAASASDLSRCVLNERQHRPG